MASTNGSTAAADHNRGLGERAEAEQSSPSSASPRAAAAAADYYEMLREKQSMLQQVLLRPDVPRRGTVRGYRRRR